MLILSRKKGERVVVNHGELVIDILALSDNGAVKIAFHASPEVVINREEVEERIYAMQCVSGAGARWR